MPNAHHTPAAEKKRHWKKSALQVFFAMLIGVALAWAMPYVIGEELGVRGVARIYAPLVGWSRGTAGRDEISVLLIDDRSLQNAQQTWPASYGYYARLLDALGPYRPRAVFIDVVFASRRDDPSLARLAEAACKASAAGTRIYLAARRSETGSFALRPELQALVPRCIEPVAIEYDPDALDQLAWNYRIRPDHGDDGTPIYSVAARIYQDLGGSLPEHGHAALAVNWGYDPAASGIEWLVPPPAGHEGATEHADAAGHADATQEAFSAYCRQPGNPLYETLPPALRAHADPDVFKPLCVFQNTLYPADLSTASDEEERQLAAQLRGKVVMIGTALQGSNDRVLSPLHGGVPGVYMHAAALDNLLHYGRHYKRTVHMGSDSDGLRVLGLLLFAFLVMVLMNRGGSALRQAWLPEPAAALPPWRRRSRVAGNGLLRKVTGFVAYTAFFTAMVFVGQALDLGMLTVAHVSLFASLAEWLEWGEKLEAWWTGESHGESHDEPHGEARPADVHPS